MVVTERQKTGRGAESSRQLTARQEQSRRPTARGSTAREPTGKRIALKEQPNEYCDLKEDVRNLWISWTATTSTGELWRRVEQSGLENALKKLSQTRADLSIITTLSTEDAVNLTAVMVEFTELLSCIRLAFVDNEKEIFDGDEHEKRFLTSTCPQILEVWYNFSSFASQFAVNIAQRCWHNSSEERELMRATIEVAASSVKLLVLAADLAHYQSNTDVETLYTNVLNEADSACKDLQDFIRRVSALGDPHSTRDSMMELIGWKLYGINHVCSKVIRPRIEARASESSFEDFNEFRNSVEEMLKELRRLRGEKIEEKQEVSVAPPPEPLQKKQSGMKKHKWSGKHNKHTKVDTHYSKDVKTEQQITEEDTKRTKESCLEVLQHVSDAYATYSESAWEKKQLPELQGTSGVKIKYSMECYDQIGRTSVKPCPMWQRKKQLDSLSLSDDHTLVSEIFVFEPQGLVCTKDIIVEMPLLPFAGSEKGDMIIKVKVDGAWEDVKVFDKINIDGELGLSFNTQKCEAFTVVTFTPPEGLVVGPNGAVYISEDVGKLEVNIPSDSYDHETSLRIKVHPFNTSSYPSMFVGTVSASPAIEVSPADSYDDSYTQMKKHMVMQLPIPDDYEDKDTEVVVVRYDGETAQVLDKRQIGLRTISTGLYTVDIKGYWCVSVLRIKRIFLNMRDSIKKEFLVGYSKKVPCNIVTFIDHLTRGNERQTFVVEAVDKFYVEAVVQSKKDVGLIEIKKGRSKDILLKRGELLHMKTDGQMRPTEILPDDHYDLCYLHGDTNVIHVSTEVKRDPEKLPDAMLIFRHLPDDMVVHSIAMMTRDLAEQPTENLTARIGTNITMLDSIKHGKDNEEASLKVLRMDSLMSLARELTFEEGSQLGQRLGVKLEKIQKIKEDSEKDHVAANFEILCLWRGRFARSTMADFLVTSLKAVGKPNYAELISEVRRHHRGLQKEDFQKNKPVKKIH